MMGMDVLTWESLRLLPQHEEASGWLGDFARGHPQACLPHEHINAKISCARKKAIMTARKHLATPDQLLARHDVGRGGDVVPVPLLAARSSALSATRSGRRSAGLLRPQRLGRPLDLEVLLFGRSFGEVVREFFR
jgi:hypothetical protein